MTTEQQCNIMSKQIDLVARDTPNLVLLQLLDPPHCDDPVLQLTYGDFKNAMDRLAWWIKDQAVRHGLAQFDTVLYVGQPDIRYFLFLVAAMKNQITACFSPSKAINHLRTRLFTNQPTGPLLRSAQRYSCSLVSYASDQLPLAVPFCRRQPAGSRRPVLCAPRGDTKHRSATRCHRGA